MILAGCSGGNVFSTTYQNFLAYFNTYHNAKKSFDEGVEEIRKAQPKTLDTNPFDFPAIPQTARTKFEAVIEKCSRIIQFYPQSSLVDDALLLIGKSYLYMKEILPATKKFAELLDNYPASDLRFEAKLGLAKAYYAGGDQANALETLKGVSTEAAAAGEHDELTEALLFEGQIYFDRKDYNGAIPVYQQSMESPGDDAHRALAAYQVAQCFELKGNTTSAADSYMKVLDFDPEYILEFHSRLRAAIMYSLSGDHERAKSIIDALLESKPAPDLKPLAELEKANLLRRQSDLTAALRQYAYVDSLYGHTDVAAKSYFQSALIYETGFKDLPKAKTYYDKAKAEYAQSEVTGDATKKAEILDRYLSYTTEFHKYDSLLTLHLHPEELAVRDSARTLLDSMRLVQRGDTVHVDSTRMRMQKDSSAAAGVIIPIDTVQMRRASNEFALGVLFFVDLNQPDSSRYWLNALLREYPETEFAPHALYVLEESYRVQDLPAQADSVQAELRSRYPRSVFAAGSTGEGNVVATSDSLDSAYAHALKLLDQRLYAQSLATLASIADKHAKTPKGAKARYAMGWIYENILMKNDSAIVEYRKLIEQQPNSIYAERVRPKLAALDVKEQALPPPEIQSKPEEREAHKKPLPPGMEKTEASPDTSKGADKSPK